MVTTRLLALAVAGAALFGLGCVGRPMAAPAPAAAPIQPPSVVPPDVEIVIPAGTFAAEMRGEPSFSVPARIPVVVGQGIAIRNEDRAMHYFFDAPIPPGGSLRKTFNQPGAFGYSPGLSCSVAREGGVTIEVRQP
jgi:hypothetical protein